MTWSAFPLLFLQASISCLAAGSAAWMLLRLALRRWPGLAMRRAPWLAAQLAGAVTLVLVMLPGMARFSVLPFAPWPGAAGVSQGGGPTVASAAASAMARPDTPVAPGPGAAPPVILDDAAVASSHGSDTADRSAVPHGAGYLPPLASTLASILASIMAATSASPLAALLASLLGWSWLACYAAGAIRHALRWRQARCDVRALLCAADRLDGEALRSHPAFGAQCSGQIGGQIGDRFGRHAVALPPVLEIDAPVSPMLVGLLRPCLLLPRHLRAFPAAQQQLIVAHELTHLRRRDHLWQHAGALLQVVQWFVPAMSSLRERLEWAQELGCDQAVLARRPAAERRHYAAALLAQLAVQAQAGHAAPLRGVSPAASLAFGTRGAQAVAERICLIRDAHKTPRAPLAGAAALLLLPALCGAAVLVQPRFAPHDADAQARPMPAAGADAPAAVSTPAPAPAPEWQAPLAQLRVNSEFGSINRPGGKPHGGIDLRARRGTAVLAPADGRVAVSTDAYEGGARYGKVIVIDHGGGMRTLYAHLDSLGVREGDIVWTGQRVAVSGATGKVTGPHLHYEVWRNGVQVDPRGVLGTGLAAHR